MLLNIDINLKNKVKKLIKVFFMSVKDMANKIMNRFRELNSKVDHVVDQKWIQFKLMPQLNTKEQDSVNDAIELLERNGFIEIENQMG